MDQLWDNSIGQPQRFSMGMTAIHHLLVLFVLGHVVHAATLPPPIQSVRFVTDNELSLSGDSINPIDDYYKSVRTIDKPSLSIDDGSVHEPRKLTHIIADDVYWGDFIEQSYPRGFHTANYTSWTDYVHGVGAQIVQLDQDRCGRMQNRLLTFADGTLACARYRQNIDQIQGELFSFYLGQFLNLTNLAPTALQVVDEQDQFWANASMGVRQAGWKALRPVVLTQHIPGLEPAGIPTHFQKPLERHLNKFDVKNITLGLDRMKNSLFEGNSNDDDDEQGAGAAPAAVGVERNLLSDKAPLSSSSSATKIWPSINWFNIKSSKDDKGRSGDQGDDDADRHGYTPQQLRNLVELAQWSDLVVFDYLIAHLDRVVNNLYNFQWNADIMEAPAHNLAKDKSDLLLFLDNESGLLHGYRLLEKYEAYHSLLLENLCVFRRSTIDQVSGREIS